MEDKKLLQVDNFVGADEFVGFDVSNREGAVVGIIYLKAFSENQLYNYREIRNGDGFRKKGNASKALRYWIGKVYPMTAPKPEMVNIGFEAVGEFAGSELDLRKYTIGDQRAKEIAFFGDIGTTLDAIHTAWFRHFHPDVDLHKSSSGGEADSEV